MTAATKRIAALLPACTVSRDHHLAGPGPARYGYAATTAAGCVVFLGRTEAQATARAQELGQSFGR
jgi:hypothetical protein